MKKLTALLLALLTLASCTADTDEIAAGLETYREVYGGNPVPVQTEATTETEPAVPEADLPVNYGTTVEGIVSPDFTINDGKLYFELTRSSAGGTQYMYSYIDLKTGNSGSLCSDPLCSHDSTETCKYFDLRYLNPTDEPGVFYGIRYNKPHRIYCADLNKDSVREIASIDGWGPSLLGYHDGKLYYRQLFTETNAKQTVKTYKIFYIDCITKKITEVAQIPEEWDQLVLKTFHNGKLYFTIDNRFYRSDPSFSDMTLLFDAGDTTIGIQWFLDTASDEIYFITHDWDRQEGSVYVVKDGQAEELVLPHSEIYYFTIDNEKIYYSTYDPIYYGISNTAYYFKKDPSDCRVYDYAGGKIYAVDRNNPSHDAELIFDNGGETMICNSSHDYMIIDDYLYYDDVTVMREVLGGIEYTYFASGKGMSKVRYNLKDGSSVKFTFD